MGRSGEWETKFYKQHTAEEKELSAKGIERSEWIKARIKLLGHWLIDLLGLRVVG